MATTAATDSISSINAIPKTSKTTLTFKSDLRKSQFDSVRPCSGILHATRISSSCTLLSSSREDHAYAWISSYDTIDKASAHLANYGFERANSEFIPYSSKSNWVTKYPHAFPYVNCDNFGHVTGFPFWSPLASNVLDIPPEIVHVAMQPSTAAAMMTMRSGGGGGGGGASSDMTTKSAAAATSTSGGSCGGGSSSSSSNNHRLPNALLTHNERNQLHKEIYNYFVWLSDQVEEMETTDPGRRSVKKVCVHALELRAVVKKLESAFKFVGSGSSTGGSGRPSHQQQNRQKKGRTSSSSTGDSNPTSTTPTLPLLEELLVHEMASLTAAEDETKKRLRAKVKAESSSSGGGSVSSKRQKIGDERDIITAAAAAAGTLHAHDFDTMFDKLVAYKDQHGNTNVPMNFAPDAQLSYWVSDLRIIKKAIEKDDGTKDAVGGDATMPVVDNELEGTDTAAPTTDVATTTYDQSASSIQYHEYLTLEQMQRLDSIGFDWTKSPHQPSIRQTKSKSWDERLNELKEWRDTHGGTFNVPRTSSLGEWLHSQRALYSRRDARFMAKKAPRMEALGYVFALRENNSVSWDDRFLQLVVYYEEHGTFDVPSPIPEGEASGSMKSGDLDDRQKFYKWVCRLHNEYRAYRKGTSSKLNAERIDKLKGIGFVFKGPKNRGRPSVMGNSPVPKLPWEKRIQQLKDFKVDTGHLNIDHNYKHRSNLGGWAAEISRLYSNWKAGREVLSEEMIANFDHLQELGFQFKVSPHYERNRSWEESFAEMLKLKEENNGKYKADLRLGKWVQTQRQQYKLWKDGKKSSLNEERIEKLERAVFEWTLAPGSGKEENDDEKAEEVVVEGFV